MPRTKKKPHVCLATRRTYKPSRDEVIVNLGLISIDTTPDTLTP
jgi:hypothetical protein